MSISAACRWCAPRRRPAPTRASRRAVSPCSSPAARYGRPAPRCGKSSCTLHRIVWASASTRSRSKMALSPVPAMSGPVTGSSSEHVSLDRDATPGAVPKPSARRSLAGHSVQRLDIPDKVFAHPRFIHDAALPGMLHGRVLRSELSAAKLTALKEDGARTACRSCRHRARRQLCGGRQRNRGWCAGRPQSLAQGRDLVIRPQRCPTKTNWLRS